MNPLFINRYRILEEVGRGGMGIVYKAEDPRLERLVALKILPPKLLHNKEALRRFLREAKVAAKLEHPHIVPIYDVGEDNGIYYMVMEYLEGATLRDWLEGRPKIELRTAIKLFKQIAEAVDYAHRRKVIHRDIKPENIMVLSTETVKVMDFGIAVMDDRHSVTQPGAVLGTIAYVSPEQAQGKPSDVRSDIYSLGIILYEFLTGRLPFQATTASEMLTHHLSTIPSPPSERNPDIPKTLDQITHKALLKNPDERYQSMTTLLQDLQKIPIPEEPEGLDSSLLTNDSFAKYRPMVERMQKEIAAFQEKGAGSTGDVADIQKKKTVIPCPRCGAPNHLTQRFCRECGAILAYVSAVPQEAIEPGLLLYREKKYEEALGFFTALLKKDPSTAKINLYLGLCQLQLNRTEESIGSFRKELEIDKDEVLAWEGLGDALLLLGHSLEALQAYQQGTRFAPSPSLWLKISKIHKSSGNLTEAKQALLQALQLDPENPNILKKLIRLLFRLKQFDEASEIIKRLLYLAPTDHESHRLLGELHELANRYSQARQAYEKALTLNPMDPQTLSQLGGLHDKQDETDLAIHHLTKVIEASPDHSEANAQLGKLYVKKDQTDPAIYHLEKASHSNPNNPDLHKLLGNLYLKKNNFDKAITQLEWTASLDPVDPQVHSQLGQIYLKRNQPQASIKAFKTAIQLDPYNPELHENLGMVYYTEEELDKAIEEIYQASNLDPENVDYRKALGVMYETRGKLDAARKEYQKVIEMSPKDSLAQGLLGRIYLEEHLIHLAMYQFQKSLDLEPRSHLIQNLQGKAFLTLGKYDEAVLAFRKALELAPKPTSARGKQILGRNFLNLGESLYRAGAFTEAIPPLEQSRELLSQPGKAYYFLAKTHLGLNQTEVAFQLLRRASELSVDDPEIFFDLANMLEQRGNLEGAIQALSEAIRISPNHSTYQVVLGDFFFKRGEVDSGKSAYQKVIENDLSNQSLYHFKLGNHLLVAQKFEDAVEQLEMATRLSPETWSYHLLLAKAYEGMGKKEEAVRALEKAKGEGPSSETLTSIQAEIDRLNNESA